MEWLALVAAIGAYYMVWPRVQSRLRQGFEVPAWVRHLPTALGLLLLVVSGWRIIAGQPISGAVLAITGLVLLVAFRR